MDEDLPLLEKRKRKPDFIKCCETLRHLLSFNASTYPSLREKAGQNGVKRRRYGFFCSSLSPSHRQIRRLLQRLCLCCLSLGFQALRY